MSAILRALRKAGQDADSKLRKRALEESVPAPTPAKTPRPMPSAVVARAESKRRAASQKRPIASSPSPPAEIHLRDYLYLALKHRWLILTISLSVPAAAFFYTIRQTPEYTASALLQISPGRANVANELTVGAPDRTSEFYGTHQKVFESTELARRVVGALRLWEHPYFGGNGPTEETPSDQTVDNIASNLRWMVYAYHLEGTQLMQIGVTSADPELSAQLTNALAEQYIGLNSEEVSGVARSTASFLGTQIQKMQQDLQGKEAVTHEFSSLDNQRAILRQKVEDLNHQLTELAGERAAAEVLYKARTSRDPSTFEEVLADGSIQAIKAQIAELESQLADLSARFKADWPDVKLLRSSIEDAKSRLARETNAVAERVIESARADYEAVVQREAALRRAMERYRSEEETLDERLEEHDRTALEMDNQKVLLQQLLRLQSEAGLSAAFSEQKDINARIVERARRPHAPNGPNLTRNVALGGVAGILLSFGLVLFIEYWDRVIYTPEDLRRHVSVSYLGMIPTYRSGKPSDDGEESPTMGATYLVNTKASPLDRSSNRVVVLERLKFVRSMLLSPSGDSCKTILVTSPTKSAGKTFVACNLAVSLADLNRRVLLVDADLRIPRLHSIFGFKNDGGLSRALSERVLPEPVPVKTTPNLFVLPAGNAGVAAADLFSSTEMQQFLASTQEEFDHVVLDSPPLLPVPDSLALALHTDRVVLVVRSGETTLQSVQASLDVIQRVGAEVSGVVLNGVKLNDIAQYYYHAYQTSEYDAQVSGRASKPRMREL